MNKRINKNLELLVWGRPDKGLNHDLILEVFNDKPLQEQVSFINEVCNLLNLDDSKKVEEKLFNVSEILFTFLDIPYQKNNNKIEVEAISRNNVDISKCDTYFLNINLENLIESFASSKNKILVNDEKLGDKIFDALYKPQLKESTSFKP